MRVTTSVTIRTKSCQQIEHHLLTPRNNTKRSVRKYMIEIKRRLQLIKSFKIRIKFREKKTQTRIKFVLLREVSAISWTTLNSQ